MRDKSPRKNSKSYKSEERVGEKDDVWSTKPSNKINFKSWLENLKKGLLLHVSMTTSESGSKVS